METCNVHAEPYNSCHCRAIAPSSTPASDFLLHSNISTVVGFTRVKLCIEARIDLLVCLIIQKQSLYYKIIGILACLITFLTSSILAHFSILTIKQCVAVAHGKEMLWTLMPNLFEYCLQDVTAVSLGQAHHKTLSYFET